MLDRPLDHAPVDRAPHFDDVPCEELRGHPGLVPETAHRARPPEKLHRVLRTAFALFLEAHGFPGKTARRAHGLLAGLITRLRSR